MTLVLAAKLVGVAAYAALEYWLGKTEKVKAGSTVEAVFNLVKRLGPKK